MTTEIDLDVLERIARAATPGPWSPCSANDGNCPCRTVWSKPLDDSPFCLAPSGPGEAVSIQDWNFVAAVNPAIALALIERVRTAERERDAAIAKLPNWLHAEALQQRNAMIAANVAAQGELRSLRALLAAARKLAPNWRDASGSATSVDAINEGCEAVTRAVEAIDASGKATTELTP